MSEEGRDGWAASRTSTRQALGLTREGMHGGALPATFWREGQSLPQELRDSIGEGDERRPNARRGRDVDPPTGRSPPFMQTLD